MQFFKNHYIVHRPVGRNNVPQVTTSCAFSSAEGLTTWKAHVLLTKFSVESSPKKNVDFSLRPQIKCAQYWPSLDRETEIFDEFIVKLSSEDHCPDYTIRHLSITNVSPENRSMSAGLRWSHTVI